MLIVSGVPSQYFLLINRGSYMGAHVLLNLFNKLGKINKMRDLPSLINPIIQEHEC